jgi:hypothetical protein
MRMGAETPNLKKFKWRGKGGRSGFLPRLSVAYPPSPPYHPNHPRPTHSMQIKFTVSKTCISPVVPPFGGFESKNRCLDFCVRYCTRQWVALAHERETLENEIARWVGEA